MGSSLLLWRPSPKKNRDEEVIRCTSVNGKPVSDILIDTGCTQTLVHLKVIAKEMKPNGAVIIRCAHDDEVSYPTTEEIAVGDQVFHVNTEVSHTLLVSVLLGMDFPKLTYFLILSGADLKG